MTRVTVTVVFASPQAQEVVTVSLAAPATVASALRDSGLTEAHHLEPERLGFAVAGRRAHPTTPVANGDRIDVAHALGVDPRQRRRVRAQATKVSAPAKPPKVCRRSPAGPDLR